MKYLITNIKYSIEQEDIDDYLEERDNPNLWGISYTEADYEQARKEIQESLPTHLIVEPDEDNDDLEEALNNEISNATGWCIETYSAEELVNIFSIEISFILNGEYYPESDIHIGTFDTYESAYSIARDIIVQNKDLYECYIYKLDKDYNIIQSTRIF